MYKRNEITNDTPTNCTICYKHYKQSVNQVKQNCIVFLLFDQKDHEKSL